MGSIPPEASGCRFSSHILGLMHLSQVRTVMAASGWSNGHEIPGMASAWPWNGLDGAADRQSLPNGTDLI